MLHSCINGFCKIRNQYLLIKSITFSDYSNAAMYNYLTDYTYFCILLTRK